MLRMRARLATNAKALPSSALLRGFGKGAIVAGFLIASLPNAMAQMSLPGDFAVTSAGGANYKIPIVVPPGTAGMVPALSLEYSSETGGNANGWLGAGLLGVGWSLGGLPAVARCPQTVAQDGRLIAVNYTSSDRFCLEGQRLIATSGAYGADGTVYGTEVESFSLIISHGTSGTGPGAGPAWFEVHTKSGQVMEFGNTSNNNSSNSQILAQGTTTVRSWAVNKVSDTKGNYFKVTYQPDATNGQAYPLRIDYTANDTSNVNLVPYNSVQFVYSTTRPDVVPIYQAGSLMQTTVRLTDVQTKAGSQLVRDYKLAYQQGSATGRSQLASVTLCGGDGSCLPATTFTWQNGTTTPTVISNVAGADNSLAGSRPYLGDFNGTGRTAILWDNGGDPFLPYSTGTRVLWSFSGSNANFIATSTANFAGQDNTLVGYVPIVADFNRDGIADIWWYALTNDQGVVLTYTSTALGPSTVWLSNGNGTYAVNAGPTLPSHDLYEFLAGGDLDGDGRTDLMWIQRTGTTGGGGLSAVMQEWFGPSGARQVANDAGLVAEANGLSAGGWLAARGAADFNGDGFTDILWLTPNGGCIASCGTSANGLWLSKGDGTFNTNTSIPSQSVAGYTPYLGDFNGDGKTDILWVALDGAGRSGVQQPILWTSRGDNNGTFVVNSTLGGLSGNSVAGYMPLVADFNGDGIADVLWVQADTHGLSTGTQFLWLGQGNGSFTVVPNFGSQLTGYVPNIGDFNGDGKADILWDSRNQDDTRSTGKRVIWLSDGVAPDLMTGVANGLGATVAITYSSITNNNSSNIVIYTKGTTATDPTVDVQAPMQVVSRVDKSNGIGGFYSATYAYEGAQFDNSGRGFLGFHQFSATDLQTCNAQMICIVQTTTFLQSFPFIMQVATDTKTYGSTILSTTTNTYGSTPPPTGSTHTQVQLNQTVTSGTDLDGISPLPTTTTTYQYDTYNNATKITVSVSDNSSKETDNTFDNDTAHWYLGRLRTSTVTSKAP
jgi:hypothetical protein